MIHIREAVIVEGKYDKIKLKEIIDAPIIETNGFRVFKDKRKRDLICRAANSRGLLIMTDSDSAGFIIRNFLKGIVPPEKIKHCYVPQIIGKEKRKDLPSKEGFLGVEGIDETTLLEALKKSGASILNGGVKQKNEEITKQDLYDLGLTGKENSAVLRKKLLKKTDLPSYLTTNAMITALNCIYTKKEVLDIVYHLDYNGQKQE